MSPTNETGGFGLDLTNLMRLQSDPVYMKQNRQAGKAIVRVVARCNDATENENLGNVCMPGIPSPVELIILAAGTHDPRAVRMAQGVTRVIHRCEDAAVTLILDLSECQLMSVPDAVYHLMRHTTLKCCNLSFNVITKIPPKLALKFPLITELNLAHNQMSKLPDELSDLEQLQRLDVSHNSFISLPHVAFKIPNLKVLHAGNNHITDVEVEKILDAPHLEEIDLRENPITLRCHDNLSGLTMVRIKLTPRQKEDWEDLTI